MDLIVGGKKIAKGEVIDKNDRYDLRIIQVVPPSKDQNNRSPDPGAVF